MAIPFYSCLKHLSPTALPPPRPRPHPLSPNLTSRVDGDGDGGVVSPRSSARTAVDWRSRCVSTAACVIIGSSIGWGAVGGGEREVVAGEMRLVEGPQARRVMRWSDVRSCPPWHANSLENIVPENLPRPRDGRRSNRLAAYGQHTTAPPVGSSTVRFPGSCFSM